MIKIWREKELFEIIETWFQDKSSKASEWRKRIKDKTNSLRKDLIRLDRWSKKEL